MKNFFKLSANHYHEYRVFRNPTNFWFAERQYETHLNTLNRSIFAKHLLY